MMRNGSARDMLAWAAANDPAKLEQLAAMAALTPDDPALDEASRQIQAEARRRVLELVAELQRPN
jgi:hypothetical protein